MFEVTALTRVDPTKNEEDWPLLHLDEASVYIYKRGQEDQLVSLYEASLLGPFRVRGRLRKVSKAQNNLILSPHVYDQDLIICNVSRFAEEFTEDGTLLIWALGSCGWYSLSPSDEYKPIFVELEEQAQLILWLGGKYPREVLARKRKIKQSIQSVYAEFAEDNPSWPTAKAAEALFKRHHHFLILRMLEKEDDWSRTPVYQELNKNYKHKFANIQSSLKRHQFIKDDERISPTNDTLEGIKPNLKESTRTNIVIAQLQKSSTRASSKSRQLKPPAKASRAIQPKLELKPPEDEMEERIALSNGQVTPILGPSTSVDEAEDDMEDDDQEGDSEDEAEEMPRSSKGKSILRPRVSAVIPAEAPSPLASHTMDDLMLDEDMNGDETVVMLEGNDTPLRHSSTVAGKRVYDDINSTERLTKRLRTLHAQSKDREMKEEGKDWPYVVVAKGKPPVRVKQLPPTSSNQPGGIWACSIQGCDHRVFEADTKPGRKLIEAHYEFHGRMMQEAMEIIGLESTSSRGTHHVDNLLAKIEAMTQTWAETRP